MARLHHARRKRLIVILIIYMELLNQFTLFLMNMCVLLLAYHLRRRTRRRITWDHHGRAMVRNVNGENAEDPATAVEGMDIDVDVEAKTHVGEEIDEAVDSVVETQTTTNVGQGSGSNSGKKGKKRDLSEGSLVEMVAESIDKYGTLYERSISTIDNLSSALKSELDGGNRRMLVYEELKKIEGLTTLQRVRVGRLICEDSYTTDIFMLVEHEDKKLLVEGILAENQI